MKITKELLQKHHACEDQAELFVSLFTEGTEVTEDACLKALGAGIDFEWACRHLLKDQDVQEASEKLLWDDYQAVVKHFLDNYTNAKKPLCDTYDAAWKVLRDDFNTNNRIDDYEAALKPLHDDFNAAENPLWDDYLDARKPFLEKYKKQQALLFYKQFNEENP